MDTHNITSSSWTLVSTRALSPAGSRSRAERDVVWPKRSHALYTQHRYSPAVRAGGLLFISGQVGAREDGTPEPDLKDEIRLAFDNLYAILEGAGLCFDDVVDTTLSWSIQTRPFPSCPR